MENEFSPHSLRAVRRACPVCMDESYSVAYAFPPMPLGYAIQDDESAARELPLYPLMLATCSGCSHTFLPFIVSPEASYSDYHFASSRSPGLISAFDDLASQIISTCDLRRDDLVVDIGSNDGSWLELFQARGMRVVGVEPSRRQADTAVNRGIPTKNSYFSAEFARQLLDEMTHPKLITANYVVANVPDLQDFFHGLKTLAGNETLISITTGYHPDQFASNMVDFIYHEHLSYFTAQDIQRLAEAFDFQVLRVRRLWLKGGSIQVLLSPSAANRSALADIERLVNIERWQGINSHDWYQGFRDRVGLAIERFRDFVEGKPALGELVGYGVSHSTTTLTYLLGLQGALARCVDDNPALWQRFAPGSGAQIFSPETLEDSEIGALIVLAWQHDYLILRKLRAREWNGTVLSPLPRFSATSLG